MKLSVPNLGVLHWNTSQFYACCKMYVPKNRYFFTRKDTAALGELFVPQVQLFLEGATYSKVRCNKEMFSFTLTA